MQIQQALAVAADWVRARDFGPIPVVGAFFGGSTIDADPTDELAAASDVDVTVVVEGAAPAKLGKLRHDGVLIEVSYLPWSALADSDAVARTHYLAPSFARDTVITDPDGRLRRLRAQVEPQFGRPAVLRARCESVFERMTAPAPSTSSWPEAVTGWLFPTSLATNVVLVAARRNPTVRLRYLRAREVLAECQMPEVYPWLLEQLGCHQVGVAEVRRHLTAMTSAFDDAARRGPTDFFFSSDITPDARPVAVGGTQALVDRGDHREAVFWLVATFSRCLQILTVTAAPETPQHEAAFADAVAELLHLGGPADLPGRRAALLEELPRWRATAAAIIDRDVAPARSSVAP